jgi:hypothetical protein
MTARLSVSAPFQKSRIPPSCLASCQDMRISGYTEGVNPSAGGTTGAQRER